MRVYLLLVILSACALDPVEPASDNDLTCDYTPPAARPVRPRAIVIGLGDSDGDGLADLGEWLRGTDPYNPDTDGDGLGDALEVQNDPAVPFDFVAAGADPRRRDVFVEVDYEVDGASSANLGTTLRAYLVFFFATLDIDNHDGTKGITLHLLDGTQLAAGYDCATSVGWTYPSDYFRQAKLCLANKAEGRGGGNVLHVNAPAADADPGNDDVEEAQAVWFRVLIHELGHTLGLSHGSDLRNGGFEPNYPSVMNYGYTKGVGGGTTLATHTVELSHGLVPDVLDECSVLEVPALTGDASFLASFDPRVQPTFGFATNVGGNTVVDWNRDNAYAIVREAADLNGDGIIGASATGPCVSTTFADNDDFAAIEDRMANALPGAP